MTALHSGARGVPNHDEGEPALTALAAVDIAFPLLTLQEQRRTRIALVASSVPHWFDEGLLGALLRISVSEARMLVGRLRDLKVVEAFPARGPGALNVQGATRQAIRRYLRTNSPREWSLFARRAAAHLQNRTDSVASIERLFHRFAYMAEEATSECRDLERHLAASGHLELRQLLTLSLGELMEEDAVSGAARVEAVLCQLSFSSYRLTNRDLREILAEVRGDAKSIGYLYGMERAALLSGDYERDHSKSEEAQSEYQQSLAICEEQFLRGKDVSYWGYRLGLVCSRLGQLESSIGRFDTAVFWAKKYLDIAVRATALRPNEVAHIRRLALANIQLGSALEASNKNEEARDKFEEALRVLEESNLTPDENSDWLRDLSVAHSRLGGIAEAAGNLEVAQRHFGEDLSIARRLAATDSHNLRWKHDLAISLGRLGLLLKSLGELSEALDSQLERLAILDELLRIDPANLNWRRSRASATRALADIYECDERFEAALAAVLQSRDAFREIVDLDPRNLVWKRELGVTQARLGHLLSRMERWSESEEELRVSISLHKELSLLPSCPGEWLRGLSLAYSDISNLLDRSGQTSEAKLQRNLSVRAMERAVNATPERVDWAAELYELRKKAG